MKKNQTGMGIKIAAEFLWVSGISLVVVGATKIWTNALVIFWSGIIIMLVGIIIKALKEQK